MTDSSRVIVAAGARPAERRLLDEIEAALPPGELAAPPVVAVVPSGSLRVHILGRLAARRPAWLGLEVTTLRGAAASILARTGGAPRSGEALEPLLAARAAAREAPLASALGGLVGGYQEIYGVVRDLLDAGFVEEHLDAVEERLALERGLVGAAAVERARAVARVAASVRRELAALGLVPESELFAEAGRRLAADPEAALPARALFVHGFADATGVASDLLAALVRHRATLVVLDSPPELDGSPATWAFGARLRERLAGLATVEVDADRAPESELALFRASDPAREARAAVGWLAATPALVPEGAGLVARDLDELPAWARELGRRALAGSAESALRLPIARRAAGLVELLARRDETPLGVVLAVAADRFAEASGALVAELRLAFAAVGVRSLAAAAALDGGALPARLPIADRLEPRDHGGARMLRRELDAGTLARAIGRLRELREAAAATAPPRSISAQLGATLRLLRLALADADLQALAEPLARFAAPGLAALEVDGEEWRRLVEAAWESLPADPVGRGGGCALLSVTEARGRTFETLAVVGLTRDRFPRAVRPDPLLPDALRLRLRDLLPDLPVKAEGHDEERFLFAQLVAAAGRAALFRPLTDGEGRTRAPSPFFDELLRVRRLAERPAPEPPVATALEAAVATALAGEREALAGPLAAALDEADERFGHLREVPSARLAAARVELLAQRVAAPWSAEARRLGPFFGFVGAVAGLDPRRRTPSVTTLERLARCGWQTFLERVLALAPSPELVEALPELPRVLVGRVVHEVLESLLAAARRRPLEEALASAPLVVAWPAAPDLERRTRTAARRHLIAEAIEPALFETPLVREALARLEVARVVDWPDGRRDLLGVEVGGEARVAAAGGERRIPFVADRVERRGDELWLTDYKTGRPFVTVVTEDKRRGHLARRIASGEALQLPVYLLGAVASEARARYLFLDPEETDERRRELTLGPGELDRVALATTLDTLFAAWDAGAFVPRLVDEKFATFDGCSTCMVRVACVQGDSGARQRFERWAQAPPGAEPAERIAHAWFELRGRARRAAEEDA